MLLSNFVGLLYFQISHLFPDNLEIAPDGVVPGEVGKTPPRTSSHIVLILFSHSLSLGLYSNCHWFCQN